MTENLLMNLWAGASFPVPSALLIVMHGNEIINAVLFSKRHSLVRVPSSYTFDREFMAIDTAFHMVFRPHFFYDALNKEKEKEKDIRYFSTDINNSETSPDFSADYMQCYT